MKSAMIDSRESFPLRAIVSPQGVTFSVCSKSGALVELLRFDHVADTKPAAVISLDPWKNLTYHYWHDFVPGLQADRIYGYHVHGPSEPQRGLRFDHQKVALDPCGKAVADEANEACYGRPVRPADIAIRQSACSPQSLDRRNTATTVMKWRKPEEESALSRQEEVPGA